MPAIVQDAFDTGTQAAATPTDPLDAGQAYAPYAGSGTLDAFIHSFINYTCIVLLSHSCVISTLLSICVSTLISQ